MPEATRERRSQAERTADTTARIVEAVYESIDQVGLARTTAAEVTGRAGVTWGAVQHHFGGKDGMLMAAVDDSFERFAERMDGIPVDEVDLEKRARLFIERAWQHFRSPEYRAAYEILRGYRGADDAPDPDAWQGRMFRAWHGVWMRIFRDSPIPRRRHAILEHYTISTLSGLASTLSLQGPGAELRTEELALLGDTLARELVGR